MMYVFSQGGEIAHSDDCHDSTNILGYGSRATGRSVTEIRYPIQLMSFLFIYLFVNQIVPCRLLHVVCRYGYIYPAFLSMHESSFFRLHHPSPIFPHRLSQAR